MLDLSKVSFSERLDDYHHNISIVTGKLLIGTEVHVDRLGGKTPRKDVEEHIKDGIWHNAYGDLRQPILELEHLAMMGTLPHEQPRVMELCNQINALLKRPA